MNVACEKDAEIARSRHVPNLAQMCRTLRAWCAATGRDAVMEAVMRIRLGFALVAALFGIAARANATPITLTSVTLTETQDDIDTTWCLSACNNAIWAAAAGFFLPAGQSLILSQTGTGGISQMAPAGLNNPYNFDTSD